MARPPKDAHIDLYFNRHSSFGDVYANGQPFHFDALIVHRGDRVTTVDCGGDLVTIVHDAAAETVNKGNTNV